MKALLALVRWDLVTQYRHGFWIAGLVVTLTWVALLRPLSREYREIWLPCLLYVDVGSIGVGFVAGLLFFERHQGVLDAIVVTPVPTSAWLISKVLSLTLLTTVVASGLVLLTAAQAASWPRLLLSSAVVAALYTLIGFLLAVRCESLSGFLASLGVIGLPLGLPLLDYFRIWSHPLLWLNPGQPALVLITRSFRPGDGTAFAGAAVLAGLWLALTFWLGLRAFHRKVSWRRGAA